MSEPETTHDAELMKSDDTGKRQFVEDSYGGWEEWADGGKQVLSRCTPVSGRRA